MVAASVLLCAASQVLATWALAGQPEVPGAPASAPAAPLEPAAKPAAKADPAEPQPSEALASRGRVFRAVKGQARAVTVTSKGALETLTAAASDVRGFAVEGPTEARARLAGAHVRVDAKKIVPGDADLALEFASGAWLDAERSPWIELVVKEVRDLRSVEVQGEGAKGTQATLVAEVTVRGVTRKVEMPRATLVFIAAGEATRSVADGDLLRIRGEFEMRLEDFGISNDAIRVRKRVAEVVTVALDLVLAAGK